MTAGPINRALLESNFQNPGDVYNDLKTEGAFDVVADQIDDNWNYTSLLVANGTLSPYPAFLSRQAIINGNFDIWQRGTSFTNPISGSYSADRFKINFGLDGGVHPTTIIHSKQQLTSGDISNSFNFYRINVNGAGSGFGVNSIYRVQQIVENGTRLLCGAGKSLTLSFYAKSDIAGKRLGVSCSQTYGVGGSSGDTLNGNNFTLTTTWTKYTVTFVTSTLVGKIFGTGNDDSLFVDFAVQWGSFFNSRFNSSTTESFGGTGNVDIAQVQLTASDTLITFQPKSFDEELKDCQRYYEKSYSPTSSPGTVTATGALFFVTEDATTGGATWNSVSFKTPKRVAPTVTVYGTGGTINTVNDQTADRALASGSFATNIGEYGFGQNYVLTGAVNRRRQFHFTADAEL